MMKQLSRFFLLCVLAVPAQLIAQDCDFDFKDKDKFSGKTKVTYWYSFGNDILYIRKLEGVVTIEIVSSQNGAVKQPVPKGAVGKMRLSNGEFISFTSREDVEAVVKVNGSETNFQSTFTVHYDISPEDLTKLSQSAPVGMKVPLGAREINKEINAKKGGKIRAAAKCIMDYKD
jgi:hypothetical protein